MLPSSALVQHRVLGVVAPYAVPLAGVVARALSTSSSSAAQQQQTLRYEPKPPKVVQRQAPVDTYTTVKGYLRTVKEAQRYEGDGSFLTGPTEKTKALMDKLAALTAEEHAKGGVLDVDFETVATITSHKPGYLDRENEVIVGLQTDSPLKRAIKPFGGWRVVKNACEAYGYELDPGVEEVFTKYRKTHNEAVFDCYSPEMRLARSNKLLTGLPDAYGRGRIVGDYRRVALFGVDHLIAQKQEDMAKSDKAVMDEATMRQREEISDQIKALKDLVKMAASYGFDLKRPARTAKEAVQWTYLPYLATVKQNDGAATSLPRLDLFFDSYIERDLQTGELKNEAEAQELIDQFFLKLRMVSHLRTPEYNALFSGDPIWATLSLGGADSAGKSLVSKTTFRCIQTLYNLGRHPEPNLTVLWSKSLPEHFKKFAAKASAETSSLQYESDDLMRPMYGDDFTISCCVSAMAAGEQTQFFGARCNLPKLLLYSVNGGVDEITGKQVGPKIDKDVLRDAAKASDDQDQDDQDKKQGEYLCYDKVKAHFEANMHWIARLYANTMNIIHYSHDRYFYEAMPMALHDTDVHRFMAFGASGIATVADSLAAIKYGKVRPIRDDRGLAVDFEIDSDVADLPRFGTDDDRADDLVRSVVSSFHDKLTQQQIYRNAQPTLSLLTITSNVVYGKQTGTTPDGRVAGQPFAPGGNPYNGRDILGALASLNSVAKVPYEKCRDGISNTFSVSPNALGKTMDAKTNNLVALLDGYFAHNGQHLNVNVMNRDTLVDAMDHPEKYPGLVVRISGYAVIFHNLTREQQMDIITRTFHDTM